MKIHNVLRLAILGASICAGLAHAEYRVNYLANTRPLIKFNELTQPQKLVLAEQAQLVLRDLYVNRYQKNEYYGTGPTSGHLDPALAAQDILNKVKAGNLSTTDLHKSLSQAFVSQRDLHLNYNFPLPYATFETFIPFEFTRTASAADQNEVRISRHFSSFYYNTFYQGIRKPAIGDQVLEYDGLPIKQAVQNAIVNGNGANLYAGFSRALQYMTYTWQGSATPPTKDTITLKLKAASNGEEYSITLPWLSFYDDADLPPTINQATAKVAKTGAALKASISKALNLSNEPIQERYNRFVARNSTDVVGAITKNSTAESSIKWAVVNRGSKKVGYLSIGTFAPASNEYDTSLSIITGLLRNQLAATDALVIDVRNNGGGFISYADMLPELFIPGKASVNAARLLNTSLNFNFLNQEIFQFYWPEWVQVITNAQKTKDRYSKTEVFTSAADANYFGQMYYKPVGVLANARSFSATDLFTCAMRDNAAATIYGEDPKTGAGGANVIQHSFFADYGSAPFQALPGGVTMRVSWRQSIRSGLAAGTMIEDQGCNADVQVPRTLADLSNGDQTQFDKIADDLLAKTPSKSYYRNLTDGSFIPVGDTITSSSNTVNLNLQVANTDLVKVYVDNVLASVQTVRAGANPVAVALSTNIANGSHQISIVGTTNAHAPLWNTKRFVDVSASCVSSCLKR
ncbi:S41 family peptidase [Undibacterium flavidum]|uniref:Tail specific protease domain-containing protein n=1 Tax=Undibacterium flavidum TaxID=2762297 RepID=A0ABR6Y9W7_9BURK|nr:S41 family peptidase [Undibacterium flavidum]MBC3872964.1 hypothetical protein [Undibacterium flavidum]